MTIRTDIAGWISDLAHLVITDVDDLADVTDRAEALASMTGAAYATEALDLVRIVGESATTPADFAALVAGNGIADAASRAMAQFLAAIARAVAIGRIDWPSRPAAISAREALVSDGETARAYAANFGADVLTWFNGLIAIAVRLVSAIAANRAPMITVETGISLPSTLLAYKLYGDPARAGALCDVAGSMTPALMPARFEALGK